MAEGTGEVLTARLRKGWANLPQADPQRRQFPARNGEPRALRRSHRTTHPPQADGRTAASTLTPWWPPVVTRRYASPSPSASTPNCTISSTPIPEADWTPIPYWMEGGADVAETIYTPFANKRDAVPVRVIVRRVKPTPDTQLALIAIDSYDGHPEILTQWRCHGGQR